MLVIQTIAGTRLDHGGTSRSVPALCEAISRQTSPVHFVTTRPAHGAPFSLPASPVNSHLVDESPRWGRLTIGRQFKQTLHDIVIRNPGPNLIHDHGIWLAPNHAVATYARQSQSIRIVSPRGMMSAWAIGRGRWKKQLAWWGYQRSDLRSAAAFHVTAKQEADEVRSLGFQQPIAMIPNGISLPNQLHTRKRQGGQRRMLFLSRIHPKKGLLELVRAWKKSGVGSDWELVIAGPNESGHQQQVEAEVLKLGLSDSISFPGPIGDAEKWQVYADADLFVLPSFSENFGIVVAEALAAGLPVITTTGTPWDELPKRGCGWWVEPTVDELARTIANVATLPNNRLVEMGQIGADWVRNSFGWDFMGQQMIQFYQWLLGDSDRPAFVDVIGNEFRPFPLKVNHS